MKIILATDGTKYADAAAKMLGNFDLKKGDEIKVLSIVDMALPLGVDMYGGYLPDTGELEKTAKENASRILQTTLDGLGSVLNEEVAISGDILFGSPESRIVETAEEMHVDLIVLGSHGYKSWERLLLGSVSNSVVHHAPCSVMVVRRNAEK